MKKILVLFLLLTPIKLFAANASSGFIDISETMIQVISGTSPRVYLYDVNMSDSECSKKTIPVLLMDSDSTVLYKEIYSMILTAKSTGKSIKFITNGCWNNGEYPIIFSAYWQ